MNSALSAALVCCTPCRLAGSRYGNTHPPACCCILCGLSSCPLNMGQMHEPCQLKKAGLQEVGHLGKNLALCAGTLQVCTLGVQLGQQLVPRPFQPGHLFL